MDDGVDEGGEAEDVDESGGLFQRDHIPPIDSDAGHSTPWTVASEEPSNPPTGVAAKYRDEERTHELHYPKFSIVLSFLPFHCQVYQAHPAWTGALREVSLDEEGEGQDGVVDQDKSGEDDPVELVDQAEIWSPVLHQAVVGIEDEESTERDAGGQGSHVNISRSETSLSDGRIDEMTGRYLD